MRERMDQEIRITASETADRKRFHNAIDSTLSGLRENPYLYQRVIAQENRKDGIMLKKIPISIVLVLVLLFAATCVAFALTNGFGILDFAKTQWEEVEVPPDAEQYIEHDLAIEETEHFTVRFRETAYDGKSCHVVYDVVPKSKDILLFEGIEDEFWYGLTHLNPDREKMLQDGRSILDVWNAGGYAEAWEVDIDVYDPNDTEFIREYGGGGVLDEETGVYTGQIEVPLATLKEERTLTFSVRMLPRIDMRDEFAVDYERAEYGYLTRTFHASVSGEEKVLVSAEPMLIPSIGVRIDQVRLMVLPQEIQYQIDYSLTDAALFHSLFDDHPEAGMTVTGHPAFRFISQDADAKEVKLLARGLTSNDNQYNIDEEQGIFAQTGSLGRSNVQEEYTLGIFRNLYTKPLIPMETITFRVQVQNPDTLTTEERAWQQKSDRSKPHNATDDMFVNPTNDDLPEADAVAIAKSAILEAHGLPAGALDHSRILLDGTDGHRLEEEEFSRQEFLRDREYDLKYY